MNTCTLAIMAYTGINFNATLTELIWQTPLEAIAIIWDVGRDD
jgi:hypothetical protein